MQVGERDPGVQRVLRQDGKEKLVFERLRAAIDAALAAHTSPQNLRDLAGQMRQAVIELRAGVSKMREDLATVERQLAGERRSREDAERRGKLAQGIGDKETVE